MRDLEAQLAAAKLRASAGDAARGEAGDLKGELNAARAALDARAQELEAAKAAFEQRL